MNKVKEESSQRKIVNNVEESIEVMRLASQWMTETEKQVSDWWKLENLNKEFLFKYAKPEEFYVVLENGTPAASAIIKSLPDPEEWVVIGKGYDALYLHWVSVNRKFAGKGYVKVIVDFAEDLAKEKGINRLRLDTDESKIKLRKVYESLGFKLVKIVDEGYRKSSYYEKLVK